MKGATVAATPSALPAQARWEVCVCGHSRLVHDLIAGTAACGTCAYIAYHSGGKTACSGFVWSHMAPSDS
jgi:hypothetical protein